MKFIPVLLYIVTDNQLIELDFHKMSRSELKQCRCRRNLLKIPLEGEFIMPPIPILFHPHDTDQKYTNDGGETP
jgi:hypothetical protein